MTPLLDFAASIDERLLLFAMVAILDLWAAALVWFSTASVRDKVLWTIIIAGCPIIGCFFWFVFGPKWRPRTRSETGG